MTLAYRHVAATVGHDTLAVMSAANVAVDPSVPGELHVGTALGPDWVAGYARYQGVKRTVITSPSCTA